MNRFILLLTFTVMALVTQAQPLVFSGAFKLTHDTIDTGTIYPLTPGLDTVTFSQQGSSVSTMTIEPLSGSATGSMILWYSETVSGNNWNAIDTLSLSGSSAVKATVLTDPMLYRKLKATTATTTDDSVRFTLNMVWMNKRH